MVNGAAAPEGQMTYDSSQGNFLNGFLPFIFLSLIVLIWGLRGLIYGLRGLIWGLEGLI